ncbi:MAG: SocA family protein [Devosia sp.]|uniref:Panacea domain-containing protein n=1 Tax=Devosia sp. 66-22 TaxID=1895753 RepID=UPI00092AC440|nr:Panacea domain-containing protein [Devosia sp. 66-22]MBN9347703.1 SocA family protein [Devosia sp.]OJX51216.1 MAG: hypothetical protein BGO81_11040 [Devosia sp. 66-22]
MPLNFRPNPEKIVELLLYLAHARPGADAYQAVKFFYLADREHLARYGRPITQESYVAMKFGPVASTAFDLLNGNPNAMRLAKVNELPFVTEQVPRLWKSPLTYIREPKREVDFDLFSKSDIRVFDEILAKYGKLSFDDLYHITHKHYAYTRAWNARGTAKASPMRYEEMIESEDARKRLVEDVGPVAANF